MKLIFYENQFIQQQTTYHIQYLCEGVEEEVYIIMQKTIKDWELENISLGILMYYTMIDICLQI